MDELTSNLVRSLCVYCGSSPGNDPQFAEAARLLGKDLAENGLRLVYGGGDKGLMGAVAESVLAHGGDVLGIIPNFCCSPNKSNRSGISKASR